MDLTTVLNSPNDSDAWAEYGDSLLRAGDPRGKAIALERTLGEQRTDASGLQAEIDEVYQQIAIGSGIAEALGDWWQVSWKDGYIERARFENHVSRAWHECPDPSAEISSIQAVLENPDSQFLRRLELQFDDTSTTPEAAAQALAAHNRVRLGTLQFGVNEEGVSRLMLEDPTTDYLIEDATARAFAQAIPVVQKLGLSGASLFSPALSHDEVRYFSSATQSVAAFHCTWFDGGAKAPPFPNATTLSLAFFDDSGHGEDFIVSGVTDAVQPRFFPKVAHLDLRRCGLYDEEDEDGLLPAIMNAPIVPQLRSLAMRYWPFGTASTEVLSKASVAFAHLEPLRLCGPVVGTNDIEAIQRVFPQTTLGERLPFVTLPAFTEQKRPPHRLDRQERVGSSKP